MPYIIPQSVRAETAPYVVFKGLFSKEECQRIIDLKEKIDPVAGRVGGKTEEGNLDFKLRRTELRWIEWEPSLTWMFEKISSSVVSANDKWWGYHLAGMNEPVQLTHYRSDDLGHYEWHEDHADSGNFLTRKLSCVLPLNDGYEGGDFEFWRLGKPQEIAVGTLIIFPSFRLHRVTPVTKGERWSLVNWINGPPFV